MGIDFGYNAEIVSGWEKRIHAAYPRLAMARSLVDAIVERAAQSAAAAPATPSVADCCANAGPAA
ncbi:hypothetical protein [Microbispora rosea]|uniref:hypothetical protein n=1 Tax=Microbispora rosea TaxID=58117 RepID=UPI003447FFD1